MSVTDEAIRDYIADICDLLEIEPPELSYDMTHAATPTMMAMCTSDGKKIHIRKVPKLTFDLLFSTAHELRHVWQIRTDPVRYLTNYKTRAELSFEAYNLQPAEIDANAFAEVAVVNLLQRRPLFQGYPEYIRKMIHDRALEILPTIEF